MRVNCPGGRSYRGYVTREVAAFINSAECDPQTRMSVYQVIIQQEKTGIEDQSPPEKIDTEENTDTENKNGTEPDEKIDNQSNMTMIHNWTEEEEKLLITLRSDMDDKFFNSKQHDTLWNEILKKMKEEGVSVSRQQVINKWKNLKKKFKEIVDSNNKTGNNPTKWKHFQRLSQLFGNKASTNPAVIIDTSNKDKTIVSESIASDSSVDMPSTSGIQATKKHKICS